MKRGKKSNHLTKTMMNYIEKERFVGDKLCMTIIKKDIVITLLRIKGNIKK